MHRLVIALTVLIGLVGAAFVAGYLLVLSASADRAARLAPASSLAYVNVYLQPSAGQRTALATLVGRLPGFSDEATFDEKIDQVAQNLLTSLGIDYRRQLRPWLGDQIAVAIGAPGGAGDPPSAVALVAVTDPAAARMAMAKMPGIGAAARERDYRGVAIGEAAAAYALVDDILVISDRPEPVEAIIDVDLGAAALASLPAYREASSQLPTDHLASVYVSPLGRASSATLTGERAGFSAAAAALVAAPEGLRLIGSAPFDAEAASDAERAILALGGESSTLVEWMPESTLVGVVAFGLREAILEAEGATSSAPGASGIVDVLTAVRAAATLGLGLSFDDDLLPLLGRESAIALTELGGPLPRGQLLLRHDDPAVGSDVMARLVDRLEAGGARVERRDVRGAELMVVTVSPLGSFALTTIDEVTILAMSSEDVVAAIEAHESGRSLARTDAYRAALDLAGERGGSEIFIDVGGLVSALGLADGLSADARDILARIGALGVTMPSRSDRIEIHGGLTVE